MFCRDLAKNAGEADKFSDSTFIESIVDLLESTEDAVALKAAQCLAVLAQSEANRQQIG